MAVRNHKLTSFPLRVLEKDKASMTEAQQSLLTCLFCNVDIKPEWINTQMVIVMTATGDLQSDPTAYMFKTQLSRTYCSVGYHLSRRTFIWYCQKTSRFLIMAHQSFVDIADLNLGLHLGLQTNVTLPKDMQTPPPSPKVLPAWDKEKPPPVFSNSPSAMLRGSHLTLAACCRRGFKMHTE